MSSENGGEKMWFKKQQEINSKEFDDLIKRISRLNLDVEVLKNQLEGLDTKVDMFKIEVAKMKRIINKVPLEGDMDQTEKPKYNDGFDVLRGI